MKRSKNSLRNGLNYNWTELLENNNVLSAIKNLIPRLVSEQLRSQRPNLGHAFGGPGLRGLHREEGEGPRNALSH